jgi:hypothetical protein|tara:strand:- start:195 stop:617 length:423 start_codon:yes stop_codon:yes gene_type:complete
VSEFIFIGDGQLVREPDDDFVAEDLPSLPCAGIHQGARAQMYSLVTGAFLEDALQMEELILLEGDDGPVVYELDTALVAQLADKQEDDIETLISQWQETQEVELLNAQETDLADFLFSLIHLCQVVLNEEGMGVFILSDG